MKKLFSTVIATMALYVSCTTEESVQNVVDIEQNVADIEQKAIEWYLFWVSWDEFGRTSADCGGIGLCNYESCFSCCIDTVNNVPVDCDTSIPNGKPRSYWGPIISSEELHYLIIDLDPENPVEFEAISEQLSFHIDEDLMDEHERVVLLEGEYEFDSEIGNHGGYKVAAMIIAEE